MPRLRVGVVVLSVVLAAASTARAQNAPDAGDATRDAIVPAVDAGVGEVVDAAIAGDAATGAAVDAPAPSVPLPRVIVVEAAAFGLDPYLHRFVSVRPEVGQFVSRTMRETAAALGYGVVSAEETIAVAQREAMPYPPSPQDLWKVMIAAHALRAAFATIRPERSPFGGEGVYVVQITVASADGGGPFIAEASAPAATLLGVVADLLRQTLPPPDVRTAPVVVTPPPTELAPTTPVPTPPHRRRHGSGHPRRWAVVGIVDAAFGLAQDFFFNFLAGGRIDYRLTQDIRVGAGVLGGAFRGKGGVAGNVLFMAQIEDRLRIASDSDVLVPLRFAVGYLPFNGPLVRVAAGVSVPFADQWEITVDILAADFWWLSDRTVVSLDLGIEIGARF